MNISCKTITTYDIYVVKRTFENSQSKHNFYNIFNQHLTVYTATKWFYYTHDH